MTKLNYTIVLTPQPDGVYDVQVPAFPEICTFGETREHAVEMARDAIKLVIESRKELNEEIPPSDTGKVIIEHLEFTGPGA
jgi:predicted RNase H-like HicB family nuclease